MNNKSIKCYVTFFSLLGARIPFGSSSQTMFAKSMFEKRKPTPFSNRIHSDNPLLTTSELGWCVKVLYLNPVYLEDSAPQHFRSAVRKTCFHEVLLRRFCIPGCAFITVQLRLPGICVNYIWIQSSLPARYLIRPHIFYVYFFPKGFVYNFYIPWIRIGMCNR